MPFTTSSLTPATVPPTDEDLPITGSANCGLEVVEDVALDDSGSPAPGVFDPPDLGYDLATGEIALFCPGGEGGAAATECDELDEGSTFTHGSVIPSNDITIGFTTSEDVALANACVEVLPGAGLPDGEDTGVDATGCDSYASTVVLADEDNDATPDDAKAWIAYFADGAVPEGEDLVVSVFGSGGNDTGAVDDCTADYMGTDNSTVIVEEDLTPLSGTGVVEATACVFDSHYAVTVEHVPTEVSASFTDASEDIGCLDGQDPVTAWDNFFDEDGDIVNGEYISFCVFDQFGLPIEDAQVTWELDGDAGDLDSEDCSDEDLDGDANGQNETCIGDADSTGSENDAAHEVFIDGLWDAVTGDPITGTSTITACVDDTAVDTDPDFGCADDAALSATVTKTFTNAAATIEVVFAVEGATNAESCETGDKFRVNQVGDREIIVVCTYDNEGNLVGTSIDDDYDDESAINYYDGGDVGPTSNPPTETGADGTATVEIAAVSEGSSDIGFDLHSADGAPFIEFSEVTKTIEPGLPVQPQCNDSVDNDGDGLVDYPADPGCESLQDNTEGDAAGNSHARTAKITKAKHVKVGEGKRSLKVKGKVTTNDGFAACSASAPVKVQYKAGGEWNTRKSSFTNSNGNFSVLIRDVTGKYRVVAVKFEVDGDTCLRDQSPVKRHRH